MLLTQDLFVEDGQDQEESQDGHQLDTHQDLERVVDLPTDDQRDHAQYCR